MYLKYISVLRWILTPGYLQLGRRNSSKRGPGRTSGVTGPDEAGALRWGFTGDRAEWWWWWWWWMTALPWSVAVVLVGEGTQGHGQSVARMQDQGHLEKPQM